MDGMQTIISPSFNVRIYAAETLNTVKEITKIHETTPNATAALGQAINAAALLGAALKPESTQNLTLRIQGSGPLKEVFVQIDAAGNLRAFTANPQIDINNPMPRISFSDAIGAGMISISKDLGLKEPYSSVSPIIKGELAEDIAYYLTKSEQIPSAVIIGFKLGTDGEIKASGGILIQTFPDTPESSIASIEQNISGLKKTLSESLAEGEDITDFIKDLLGNSPVEIISRTDIRHKCRCSTDLLRNVIKTLPKTDISEMIEKEHGTEIDCTFCRKTYKFGEHDLRDILEEMN
ncbi:MAG: Hsp33 family molecular chaperone HslO [Spirochaetes bacterium]|nr:Hsp33 family molecular chaperone HslO [Spirochaetota bacterium]